MRSIIKNILITASPFVVLIIVATSHSPDHMMIEANHVADLWLDKDCFVGDGDTLESLLHRYRGQLEERFLELAVSGPGDSTLQSIQLIAERHFDKYTVLTAGDSSRSHGLKFLPGERNDYLEAILSREILASRIRAVSGLSLIGSKRAAAELRLVRHTAQPALRKYIDRALRAIDSRGRRN